MKLPVTNKTQDIYFWCKNRHHYELGDEQVCAQ